MKLGAGCSECPYQDLEVPHPHRTITMLLELIYCLLSARFLCTELKEAAVPTMEEVIISWRAGYSQNQKILKRAWSEGTVRQGLPTTCAAKAMRGSQSLRSSPLEGTGLVTDPSGLWHGSHSDLPPSVLGQ